MQEGTIALPSTLRDTIIAYRLQSLLTMSLFSLLKFLRFQLANRQGIDDDSILCSILLLRVYVGMHEMLRRCKDSEFIFNSKGFNSKNYNILKKHRYRVCNLDIDIFLLWTKEHWYYNLKAKVLQYKRIGIRRRKLSY